MLTKRLWWNFEFKINCSWNGNYSYSNVYMAWLLIGTILGTPFVVVLDIIFAPIEIIYSICLKIVNKLRR